jgi:hypothetical protein
MRRFLMVLLLLAVFPAFAADVVQGRLLKTLPLFLDMKGHDAVSPSLYDRDAYQAYLRQHPGEISALRFDVLWKAAKAENTKLKIRIELHGIGADGLPRQTVLEQEVTPKFFRSWTSLTLGGDEYKTFNAINAWRATLWSDDQMIGEQKSFLW